VKHSLIVEAFVFFNGLIHLAKWKAIFEIPRFTRVAFFVTQCNLRADLFRRPDCFSLRCFFCLGQLPPPKRQLAPE